MQNTFYGNTFSDALKWALKQANISQTELAKLLNVSRSQVSNMVNGHFSPSEKKIREIEQALDYMFKFEVSALGFSAYKLKDGRIKKLAGLIASEGKDTMGRRAFSEGYLEMLDILNLIIHTTQKNPDPAINHDTISSLRTIRYLLDKLYIDYIERGRIISLEENVDSDLDETDQ